MKPSSFPYPHPVFGARSSGLKPEIDRSPYYWWWEHLRRNAEYRAAILDKPRKEMMSVVEDFGDVFSVDFKTWWRSGQRGARLFANPSSRPSIELLGKSYEISECETRLLLSVDLKIPMADLVKRFRVILRSHHHGKAGKQASRTTQAKYRLSGPPHIEAWRIGLQIYDAKMANPKLKLWEIARLCPRIWNSHAFDPSMPSRQILDQKNRVQVLVSRHLTRTKKAIANTSQGKFP